jgi:hypothetical protein
MIEPALRTPLVAAVGAAPLLATGLITAGGAAIALAAIAVLTDPEHRVALPAAANPLTENRFAMDRHPRRQAGLDNGSQSWQVKTIHSIATCFFGCRRGLRRFRRRGPTVIPAFEEKRYTIGEPIG